MAGDAKYWEHGFEAKEPVKKIEYMGEAEPGYLEGHNASPKFKKAPFESEGEGSKGPAAR